MNGLLEVFIGVRRPGISEQQRTIAVETHNGIALAMRAVLEGMDPEALDISAAALAFGDRLEILRDLRRAELDAMREAVSRGGQ